MFSVPLICSSSGVATVSAITLGLAPGNCAFTTTDGGTTSGYSEIGSRVIAISPARKITIEITPAKIGRSMKNLDRLMASSESGFRKGVIDARGLVRRELACEMRLDRCSRLHALHAVDDDLLAGAQAREHDALAVHLLPQRDFAIVRL